MSTENQYQIMSITRDPSKWWNCLGRTRDEAEATYRRALDEWGYARPLYRVIARRKSVGMSWKPGDVTWL